ncbi:MAG: hypothetical protein KC708_15055 [Anaerolineae bacterium]|nr:hypothetical protein [Anaerolineae bacterium]
MGDWTSIQIDGQDIWHIKNKIFTFAIMLFDESDLCSEVTYNGSKPEDINFDNYDDSVQSLKDLEDTKEIHYWFESSVRKVRQILTNRGIDDKFCHQVFELLKAPHIFLHDAKEDEDNELTNIITYGVYKTLMQHHRNSNLLWQGDLQRYLPFEFAIFSDDDEDFWTDDIHEFVDAWRLMKLRLEIDLAPNNAQVKLPLFTDSKGVFNYQDFIDKIGRKFELDYLMYGFVLRDDPMLANRLVEKVSKLSEDTFIKKVLVPLLKKMGFMDVQAVNTHGQGEFGKDILPFKQITEFDTIRYLAVQAKAVKIHGKASSHTGNAAELLNQAVNAFDDSFIDTADNKRKYIDEFIIAASRDITAEARKSIENKLERNQKITFLDLNKVIELIKKYNLVEYVLFAVMES